MTPFDGAGPAVEHEAVTAKPQGPEELISIVYALTDSADARALVAHVAVAIHLNKPEIWAALAKARTKLEPKESKRASMRAGLAAMPHVFKDWAPNSATQSNWVAVRLQSVTAQPKFAELTTSQIDAVFGGLQQNPARTRGGRSKGGSGNRSSMGSALAALACACQAWGFKPGDQEKARKQIGARR